MGEGRNRTREPGMMEATVIVTGKDWRVLGYG